MKKPSAVLALSGLLLGVTATGHAQSGTVSVDTRTSLYLAGGNVYTGGAPVAGQAGLIPTAIALNAGVGRELRVSALGSAAFCGAGVCVTTTPDGPSIGATNLTSSGNISGIIAPTSGFLAGVFLGASLPGSAPASLDFTALTTNFTTLAPALGQLFFIGDGFTAGAVQQRFLAPDAATRLYFGIADGGSFQGTPGFYDDNVGEYRTTFAISAVPEPSTWALLGTGLATLGLVAARRRRRDPSA